mmetsp:Transcript_22655/g.33123  ORF Transcript_22655/g.33123 Transcript_22655/m.33123 type:complete len:92 (+) Transcript_22655:935-1210(+)
MKGKFASFARLSGSKKSPRKVGDVPISSDISKGGAEDGVLFLAINAPAKGMVVVVIHKKNNRVGYSSKKVDDDDDDDDNVGGVSKNIIKRI